MITQSKKNSVFRMTFTAIMTAIVVVLQLMGSFIHLGPFSVSLVLLPIVIGAAYAGTFAGMWLGLVFGVTVLLSGDAATFFAITPFGTIVTVLVKGMLCGLCAGLVFNLEERNNRTLAVILSAITCPVVNTGVFLIGCRLFFFETIKEWSGGENVFVYMLVGLVGANFLFELLFNIVLSPVLFRLLNLRKNLTE